MRTVLLLTSLLCAAPAVASALPETGAGDALEWSEAALARLRAGEVLLEHTRTEEAGGAARVVAVVYADVERIWAVLTSCERSFEYVDGMETCEVVEGGLERAVVKQGVKKAWIMPRLDYTVEFIRRPYTHIEFRRIDGDLELLEGSWSFEQAGAEGAVLVTHEVRVRPRIPAPRWLVRRSIRKDIPDMLACLRSLADGSGSAEQWRADNRRCPKPGRRDR